MHIRGYKYGVIDYIKLEVSTCEAYNENGSSYINKIGS
jgi:hypothetical protein